MFKTAPAPTGAVAASRSITDLPPELLCLIVSHLLANVSWAESPPEGEAIATLTAVSITSRRLHACARSALFRRPDIRRERQATLLVRSLREMDLPARGMVRELSLQAVHPVNFADDSDAPSMGTLAQLLSYCPDLRHLFIFDFLPLSISLRLRGALGSLVTLEKLSFYITDRHCPSGLVRQLFKATARLPKLHVLNIAAACVRAPSFQPSRGAQAPPIEDLSLIVQCPGHGGHLFWPSFAISLGASLRFLSINVGSYLCELLQAVRGTLQGLALTPFAYDYQQGWWLTEMPRMTCLALGLKGWMDFDPETALACQNVREAVLYGFDVPTLPGAASQLATVVERLARAPRVHRVIATELEPLHTDVLEARAQSLQLHFVAAGYSEVDLRSLCDNGRLRYKYAPM